MAGITHADLIAVQNAITNSVRGDIDRVEENLTQRVVEVKENVDALKDKQDVQNGRVNRHEAKLAAIDARLDERARHSLGLFRSLTKKQKAALWTMLLAASGSLLDGLRHVAMFLVAAFTNGVRP